MICPASGPSAPAQPKRCDDTAYGKGAGGQLAYKIKLKAGAVQTVWFGVGGSTAGPAQARAELRKALSNPEAAIRAVVSYRERVNTRSDVSLPGDPRLTQKCGLVEADAGGFGAAGGRYAASGCQRRQRVPTAGRNAEIHALARRRLAGLHLAVRHRW